MHCGRLNTEAHHPDYDAPLDVVWLCARCHRAVHGQEDPMKLYEITEAIRSALLTLAEPQPDANAPDYDDWCMAQETAQRHLDGLEFDLKAKLRAYVALAQELKVARESREAEIDRIHQIVLNPMLRANAQDLAREQWLMAQAAHVIEQFGVELPLKFTEFTLGRRKLPPHVEVIDAASIPEEYQRVVPETREPDKKHILADLKEGVVIPGCALSAPAYTLTVK